MGCKRSLVRVQSSRPEFFSSSTKKECKKGGKMPPKAARPGQTEFDPSASRRRSTRPKMLGPAFAAVQLPDRALRICEALVTQVHAVPTHADDGTHTHVSSAFSDSTFSFFAQIHFTLSSASSAVSIF